MNAATRSSKCGVVTSQEKATEMYRHQPMQLKVGTLKYMYCSLKPFNEVFFWDDRNGQ